MPFYRAFAIRLGRWLRGLPPLKAAAPEQRKLLRAHGLLVSALTETRAEKARSQSQPCDWTSPQAYWKGPPMAIADDFDEFVARLRTMSDEDVALAFRFEGGEGPRAAILAAEMRRRNAAR